MKKKIRRRNFGKSPKPISPTDDPGLGYQLMVRVVHATFAFNTIWAGF